MEVRIGETRVTDGERYIARSQRLIGVAGISNILCLPGRTVTDRERAEDAFAVWLLFDQTQWIAHVLEHVVAGSERNPVFRKGPPVGMMAPITPLRRRNCRFKK
jgi:hypothetical protein